MKEYNFKEIEDKWQKRWEESECFKAVDFHPTKPKFYVLSEFFGPSGRGIHIGHVKCFTPSEVIARYKRLAGYNVLYPAGWDAFGLPTENYAIKTGERPKLVTERNIEVFKKQLKSLGYSFDWSREINTSDEEYYRWTQWIFLQLFNHNMAYKEEGLVNFCPNCKTVLSNEDSQGGECDRCHGKVIEDRREVWYLRMKNYSEKMLAAIDRIDMGECHKLAQRNWIGKSEGAELDFQIKNSKHKLRVYTTRPDTLFGATFMVIAPEHPFVSESEENILNIYEVKEYILASENSSEIERGTGKDKTGVKLEGIFAINPINGREIPVFVADYVIWGYGTGAIMAVPAHDERDYVFAKKYNIEIIEVISGGDISKEAYTGDGVLVNSSFLNGLNVDAAKNRMIEHLVREGIGESKTNYLMQNWPFNRQRYWGEPFPIVICNRCGYVALPEGSLPLVLPEVQDYTPDSTGNGPLSKAKEWSVCTCPKCGGKAKRETDTMPNWAGSSWYWLRFMDPHNKSEFVSKERLKYWGEVDLYTGGVEHVTRHMLYASFWHNFLYDIGAVPNIDPFKRRMCNGLILDEKGKKMGKSSGNSVDPYAVVGKYGADTFRLHILFIGDYERNTIWTFDGINGQTRFLSNVWGLQEIVTSDESISKAHEFSMHKLIKKASEGIERFEFNTVIAEMMTFVNEVRATKYITKGELKNFLVLLNPFAPHITSEIYENVFDGDIMRESFPKFDESKLVLSKLEIPVQVNGKLRGTVTIEINAPESEVVELAKSNGKIIPPETVIKKIIYIKGKILNLIV